MNTKKILSLALATGMLLPTLSLTACGSDDEIVLRVYNWEEYIDEGGSGSYVYDTLKEELDPDGTMSDREFEALYKKEYGKDVPSNDLIDDFEEWYEKEYGVSIRVEYSTFGTNEDMYNQLKLGDKYDVVCPSDYMIMKMIAEDMLEPYTDDFFDETNENNYYVNNVSSFISNTFETRTVSVTTSSGTSDHTWSEYAAGYMWGTTGFIYNPIEVNEDDLAYWDIMLDSTYKNKVTTKDNVRDSYFVGLAIYYQDELLSLRELHESGNLSDGEYTDKITEIMNRTDEETVAGVQDVLLEMKNNIYGFETDTGKNDMVTGKICINFAWSGDAVYAMDLAESESTPVYLNYYIPEECANMWFDGWVMPKGSQVEAAQAFVNFLSNPENAVRNMYYIGYSSVIAGEEVFEYISDLYSADEEEEDTVEYDLSYFFGENSVLIASEEQTCRQLYAQYPTEDVMLRCAVMDYFDSDTNDRINELWTQVKGASLDAWAIIVICVAVVVVVGFVVCVKLEGKVNWFRLKPKKGYKLVGQEKLH